MTFCAALAPIEECTDPFRVGAELDVSLWLSAYHVYSPGNRLFDCRAYADPSLGPVLHQPAPSAARPNLTLLRSTVTRLGLATKTTEYGESLDLRRSRIWVEDPLPMSVGFWQLQQGPGSAPVEIGQSFATLGSLSAHAHAHGTDKPLRVRVEAVLALDLEPLSPTFGGWRKDEVWIEGAVDVSNLDVTTVLARLTVLGRIVEAWP